MIEKILIAVAVIFVLLCFNSLAQSVSDAASSLRDIKWSLQSRNIYQHQKLEEEKLARLKCLNKCNQSAQMCT